MRAVGVARSAVAAALAVLWLAIASAPVAASPSPLSGTSLWVARLAPTVTSPQLVAEAREAGARTLLVKAADGSTPDAQFSPVLLAALRAEGIGVCAWTFAYGVEPLAEAAVAVAAVRAGAQCLVVDAEGQYDSRYGQAQAYVGALRSQLGGRFPIGLAGQAEVNEHPKFPYSVFLGPGAFEFDLPQMYWRDLGLSVARAYTATISVNAIYGRPIVPVGQLYDAPAPAELESFQALAGAYGSPGASFFDLDSAAPEGLAALAVQHPSRRRVAVVPATLRPGADGDEIVWAQELLNAAGARLPVGGFYGAQTASAVARFQLRHHVRADGVLGAATWRALLRLRPRAPSWAAGPPDSAR